MHDEKTLANLVSVRQDKEVGVARREQNWRAAPSEMAHTGSHKTSRVESWLFCNRVFFKNLQNTQRDQPNTPFHTMFSEGYR